MHNAIAVYRTFIKAVFTAGVIVLCALSYGAGAATSPFPGSFPLDTFPCPPWSGTTPTTYSSVLIPDDPICFPVICGYEIPVMTCLAAPAQNCCKDDRLKDLKLVGPAAAPLQVGNTVSPLGTTGPAFLTSSYITQFSTDITGPSNGVQGVMPSAADNPLGMPHKDTPAIGLVTEYPWEYLKPEYFGQYQLYRGGGNNTYATIDQKLSDPTIGIGDDDNTAGAGGNPESVNTNVISYTQCRVPASPQCAGTGANSPDYPNNQYWIRMQRDACTNQYIIPMGLNPEFMFSDSYRYDNVDWNESYCQALVLTPLPCLKDLVNDNTGKTCLQDNGSADLGKTIGGANQPIMYDYRAWGYLEEAWQNVLNPGSGNGYGPASGTNPNALSLGAGAPIQPIPVAGQESYGQPFDYNHPGSHDTTSTAPPSATFKGNLTTINDLSLRSYERIFDSTHPFTPRFDVSANTVSSTAIFGNTLTDRAYSDLTNLIPLAGGFNLNGYNAVPSSCYVRCASVPVDVLSFRAAEFNSCMTCRINVMSTCFWDEVIANIVPTIIIIFVGFFPIIIPLGGGGGVNSIMNPITALIDTIEGESPTWEWFDNHDCKTYLQQDFNPVYSAANNSGSNISAGGAGIQAGLWPPCSTQFDTPLDNVPNQCNTCVQLANDYADNAFASSISSTDTGGHPSSVTKCCSDLAQALAPINTLKIRNLQDDPTLLDSANNAAEGYVWMAYFPPDTAANAIKDTVGNTSLNQTHMPYMRWWDTGQSAGGAGWPQISPLFLNAGTNYDPICDKGKNDVVVGVGIESQATPAVGSPAGLCRYGGNAGKPVTWVVGGPGTSPTTCINVGATTQGLTTAGAAVTYVTDRLTSWMELKEYQTNAMRYYGLNCMPIFEQLYKHVGTEDGPLTQAGKHYNTMVPEPGFHGTAGSDTTNSLYELKQNPWPLRWRGYLSDQQNGNNNADKYRFPNFDPSGGTGTVPAMPTGLDNAKTGDIIYWTEQDNAGQPAGYHVPPFIAVVTDATHNTGNATANTTGCEDPTNCTDKTATCSDFVEVVDQNYGKYPDACGNTDYIGQGQTRRIFKEWLPPDAQDALFMGDTPVEMIDSCNDTHIIDGGGTASNYNAYGYCMDPKYSVCTFNYYFSQISVYDADAGTWAPGTPTCGTGSSCPGLWNSIHIYRPSLDERSD